MAVQHKIVQIPNYLSDVETYLNTLGADGWVMVELYNQQAFFVSGGTTSYKIVQIPNYITDVETYLNTLGSDGWELISIYNQQAFLKFSN